MKAFTAVELMVVVAILFILAALIVPVLQGQSPNISCGPGGCVEIRCVHGYKFSISPDGNARQLFDSSGKGIICGEAH